MHKSWIFCRPKKNKINDENDITQVLPMSSRICCKRLFSPISFSGVSQEVQQSIFSGHLLRTVGKEKRVGYTVQGVYDVKIHEFWQWLIPNRRYLQLYNIQVIIQVMRGLTKSLESIILQLFSCISKDKISGLHKNIALLVECPITSQFPSDFFFLIFFLIFFL